MTTDGTGPADARLNDASRRRFLRAGAAVVGGLSFGDLLGLRAAFPSPVARSRPRSLIMIFLSGGPSHLDMFDMKPDAPAEYRGEFRPIPTSVPGLSVCELMPMQAKVADRFSVLRGVRLAHLHTGNEFYSGYPWQESPRASVPGEARRPAVGSVVSRLRGGDPAMPPYVSLSGQADWERAYYLGLRHEPFRTGGGGVETMENMVLRKGVTAGRLEGRKGLLHAFDTIRRDIDRTGAMEGLDAFQARALEMVVSGKVRDAFDIDREPAKVRERYGDRPYKVINQECKVVKLHEVEHPGRALLRARRLVEAGVSVVTVTFYDWDTHRYNFTTLRQLLPPLDQAVTALLGDLEGRGLIDDVVVLMGGEFGRTPRIGDVTPDGRSHWPEAGFLWVAGGGIRTGQVIGATDARGERALGRPLGMQNVLATLYPLLGVDPSATLPDFNGRPQYLLEDREPVAGLV
jgi:hypothetical protein